MTSEELAHAYLRRARARLGALAHLRDAGDHSDVVREAQELVELALKGMLRAFYGDVDFIPTEEYTEEQAAGAYDEAAWVLALAQETIGPLGESR